MQAVRQQMWLSSFMDISVAAALQGKRVLASHHQQATKCLSWLDFLFQKNHKNLIHLNLSSFVQ